MEATEFKTLLGEVGKLHGFTAAHGGWYRETPAALFVLNLQKSNFGNYFELNLKLFLGKGLPGTAAESKKLVKSLSGDIFRRQPEEYREVFDLDAAVTLADRRDRLDKMFTELVDRIASAAASPFGLLRLRDQGGQIEDIHDLPGGPADAGAWGGGRDELHAGCGGQSRQSRTPMIPASGSSR